MSTCKRLLVTLLALAALPQGAAAGLRQLAGKKETFCMELQLVNNEWKITEVVGFNARKGCSGKTIDVVDGELKIPKEHDGKPITKIRKWAFRDQASTDAHSRTQVCNSLKSVKMPSIKEIGVYAFRQCHKLASVKMPSIKEIGKGAFRGCTKLASVEMPTVTKIGKGAFRLCTELNSVYSTVTFVKIVKGNTSKKIVISGNTACDHQPMFKDTC